MNVNEAYQTTERHFHSAEPHLAPQIERLATKTIFPITWLCAAGAYARSGDKQKFTEALAKASEQAKDEAISTLADHSDIVYNMIVDDFNFLNNSRLLFAQQLHKKSTTRLSVDELAKILEGHLVSRTRKSALLSTGNLSSVNLIFQSYRLETREDADTYHDTIRRLKEIYGTLPNHPIVISNGIDANIGWFFGHI